MKGLELSRTLYETQAQDMLKERFPALFLRMAIGLAGEGSECLGFDDELSQDHDWGPGFCIWLSREDFHYYGKEVQAVYDAIPALKGIPPRQTTPQGAGRVWVLCVENWYQRYTGVPQEPRTLSEWRAAPESFLSVAVSGEVFYDPTGSFSAVRDRLLKFYPEDLRLKKIAARAAVMAQAGQYNYARCLARGERVAANLALAEFTRAGMSMAYLLNRRYAPFYKWMHRGMKGLPVLSRAYELFGELAWMEPGQRTQEKIEDICSLVAAELRRQGLSHSEDSFLLAHAPQITDHIRNEELREAHIMEE